jgi:hypothetical protein
MAVLEATELRTGALGISMHSSNDPIHPAAD